MDPKITTTLKRLDRTLVGTISTSIEPLLDFLLSKYAITWETWEDIRVKAGDRDKTESLVNHLQQRKKEVFTIFQEYLEKHQPVLAKQIKKEEAQITAGTVNGVRSHIVFTLQNLQNIFATR